MVVPYIVLPTTESGVIVGKNGQVDFVTRAALLATFFIFASITMGKVCIIYFTCPHCDFSILCTSSWMCSCGHRHGLFSSMFVFPFTRHCGHCKQKPTSLRCPECHGDIVFNESRYDRKNPQEGRALLLYDVVVKHREEHPPSEGDEIQREVERLILHTSSVAEAAGKLLQRREDMKRKARERMDLNDEQKADLEDFIDTQIENGIKKLKEEKGAGRGS